MSEGTRFLTIPDVAEILNTSQAQVTALVRRGDLVALKLGGRGQWRVEVSELEAFIQRMYAETRAHLKDQGSMTPGLDVDLDAGLDGGVDAGLVEGSAGTHASATP